MKMKVYWVYKILPAFVFFTERFIPKKYQVAVTRFFICVFVRPNHIHQKCFIEHELTHVKQTYRTLFLFPFLYLIPYFRFMFEAEAYARQAICFGKKEYVHWFAQELIKHYNLNISYKKAYNKILNYYNRFRR